jgi:hypothetical protein
MALFRVKVVAGAVPEPLGVEAFAVSFSVVEKL